MIPTDWTPYVRESDGELLGYLVEHDGVATPLTVFGYPLAGSSDRDGAVEVLRTRGLTALAERWLLHTDDGREVSVLILAAYPDEVLVAQADYGFVSHDSERFTVPVPAEGRLQPA
ncbi:MAG TPA: hypothetical protein VIT20_02455 [Propionibacteriaceae bacterium]